MSSTTQVSLSRIGQLVRHLAILQFADLIPQDLTLQGCVSELLQGGATKEEAAGIMKEVLDSAVKYSVQTFDDTQRTPPTITESPSDERIGQIYTKVVTDRMKFETAEAITGIVGHLKNAGADDAEVSEIMNFFTTTAVQSTVSETEPEPAEA